MEYTKDWRWKQKIRARLEGNKIQKFIPRPCVTLEYYKYHHFREKIGQLINFWHFTNIFFVSPSFLCLWIYEWSISISLLCLLGRISLLLCQKNKIYNVKIIDSRKKNARKGKDNQQGHNSLWKVKARSAVVVKAIVLQCLQP